MAQVHEEETSRYHVKNRVNNMPLPEGLGFVFIGQGTSPSVACTLQVTRDRLNNLIISPNFMYKMRCMFLTTMPRLTNPIRLTSSANTRYIAKWMYQKSQSDL